MENVMKLQHSDDFISNNCQYLQNLINLGRIILIEINFK